MLRMVFRMGTHPIDEPCPLILNKHVQILHFPLQNHPYGIIVAICPKTKHVKKLKIVVIKNKVVFLPTSLIIL